MTRRIRALSLGLLLVGGCDAADRPLDGGQKLNLRPVPADEEKNLVRDPCLRREKGGWHRSIGHCAEMLPPQLMTGVWVTGFEESSYFPGAAAIPDGKDGRRFRLEIEVDGEGVEALAGHKAAGLGGDAYRLTFRGRRTRWPLNIDCYGGRDYMFIADELESATYLGKISPPAKVPMPWERRPYRPFKRSGEGGRIAELENEALERCGPARG